MISSIVIVSMLDSGLDGLNICVLVYVIVVVSVFSVVFIIGSVVIGLWFIGVVVEFGVGIIVVNVKVVVSECIMVRLLGVWFG